MLSFPTQYDMLIRPGWPRSHDPLGFGLLIGAGVLLLLLTLWTYAGHPGATKRRLIVLLGLRLLALLIALLVALRPSLAVTEIPKIPSVLVISLDHSESMTINDGIGSQTRWDELQSVLKRSRPQLERLMNEFNVRIDFYRFAADFNLKRDRIEDPATIPSIVPDGKRTEIGLMLNRLYAEYNKETNPLRGLLLLSDGRDNGDTDQTLSEADRYGKRAFPIFTFKIGQTQTNPDSKDIDLREIEVRPNPVPLKKKITIVAKVNAFGYVNAKPIAKVYFTEKGREPREVLKKQIVLDKAKGNEISLEVDESQTPAEPGEIKIRMEIEPLPGEPNIENNSIETYVSIVKEGLSVLLIDRLRLESKYLRMALSTDDKISYHELIIQGDTKPQINGIGGSPNPLGELDKYDVLIIGDVSAKRLFGGDAVLVQKLADQVKERRLGIMMIGGVDSFGGTPGVAGSGDWLNADYRSIVDLFPVEFRPGQIERRLSMKPVIQAGGPVHYIMRLDEDTERNLRYWDNLNGEKFRLNGMNQLGSVKPNAVLIARADDDRTGDVLLVGREVGTGRTLAFGGDTTWMWYRLGAGIRELDEKGNRKPTEGMRHHTTFWRNVVRWLAKQDVVEGSLFIEPRVRRLIAGGEQIINIGMLNKNRQRVPDAELEYQIVAPGEQPDESKYVKIKTGKENPDGKPPEPGRVLSKPRKPGEYKMLVRGKTTYKGENISGSGEVTYLVVPAAKSEELAQAEADHAHMENIAAKSNGKSLNLQELPEFLEELMKQPLPQLQPKPRLLPNWRRDAMPWFLPTVLIVFVVILSLEWGLRRFWGLV